MTTFAVFKNGQIPTLKEFEKFSTEVIGNEVWTKEFFPHIDDDNFGIGEPRFIVANIETTLFTEQQLDSFSMDWEFIEN